MITVSPHDPPPSSIARSYRLKLFAMQCIVVDSEGTKLSYIDSGVPQQATEGYTTIFAVHGTVFTSRECLSPTSIVAVVLTSL